MTVAADENEEGRANTAGIRMLAIMGAVIVLFALSRFVDGSRIARFKQFHPTSFSWTVAVVGANVAVVLLAAVVLWECPPRPLIPDNRLTVRLKQIAKFLVGVTTFGLAAFWGALAGAMMPSREDKFTTDDMNHLLGQVVGEPLKFTTLLAAVGMILALCLDLYVVGRDRRESAFRGLRPSLAWLCTFLTAPWVIGTASYLSLGMVLWCVTLPVPQP
ncbi:hypothetical protein [Mycobacteroides abscessus]|uniref:hypothetical protein n=1 Tax=Mycobacteroides abscessus TaxID=36809 RepID=UPI00092B438A|nr:hypothetical protein [Mycobacteroides abscessus]QST90661.1 hypothetical protein PROPHIGD52-1_31 [Mycobacterium phage prophi52-1]MBN7332407.1 hypothetical protein [Mycobacteroides abscessus subsp. abscessus]SHX23352.1 Uncharacterised protein [Mycobacteroides abscessus subsp. abscessus]SHY14666.1 Uncharacterised protein [Mycobacteroides abscessus subsp. abscessus]SIA41859.1 Uncharacterised protein [Mycobacteroides abscessus subsp. abscessus]